MSEDFFTKSGKLLEDMPFVVSDLFSRKRRDDGSPRAHPLFRTRADEPGELLEACTLLLIKRGCLDPGQANCKWVAIESDGANSAHHGFDGHRPRTREGIDDQFPLVGEILEDDPRDGGVHPRRIAVDRKSTRLNSSHVRISYAVFCLKKK